VGFIKGGKIGVCVSKPAAAAAAAREEVVVNLEVTTDEFIG